jgi:hypothetical protein
LTSLMGFAIERVWMAWETVGISVRDRRANCNGTLFH